jgi:hypothetical protein
MKEIPLTKGFFALVDDEDYESLMKFKWYAREVHRSVYAERGCKVTNGKREAPGTLKMHRIIMNCPDGMQVDHINHNSLDNRKVNLRLCTPRQNQFNKRPIIKYGRRYMGVDNNGFSWVARIVVNYKKIYLGSHETEEAAAIAYNNAAIKHFGEFANLNIIQK